MENELPKGWSQTNIGFILTSKKGKKPKSTITTNQKGFDPYILIDEMEGAIPRYYTDDKSVPRAKKQDVLLVWDGSIGKCASGIEGAIGSTIVSLTPKQNIPTEFLEHLIRYLNTYIKETSTGTGLQHINKNFFTECIVPVPPIEEQRRISFRLNSLFSTFTRCSVRLHRIPSILTRIRQSTLNAAIKGDLSKDWRTKNNSVRPFPIDNSKHVPKEIIDQFPTTWRVVELGKLTEFVTSGSRGWAKFYSDSGSIFIRAQNINSDYLNLSDVAFVKLPDTTEGLRTKVKKSDLLITITGANVAKSAIVENELSDAYVSQHVALARLKDPSIGKFVYLNVVCPDHGRKYLLESAYGQGKPGLNLDNIKNLVVALPPIEEQTEIVRKVEELFKYADKIEERYTTAKEWFDKIPQAILAKAFRGELVPQDENDEPASELLKRIKAEKEKSISVKPVRLSNRKTGKRMKRTA